MKKVFFSVLSLILVSSSAFAQAKKVEGLECKEMVQGREISTTLYITTKGAKANVIVSSPVEDLELNVGARDVAPILEGNLEAMNNARMVDKKQNIELNFRVNGQTFDKKPRLSINVTTPRGGRNFVFCGLRFADTARF